MNLLIIKDDKPGHYNQTEGLLLQLKEVYPDIKVEYIDVEIKSKLKRKLLRFLLNSFSSFFENKNNLKYLPFFYKKSSSPLINPDLIISTGGNTSNLNAWLSKAYECKNILNGSLRGLNETLFTNITTVIDLGYKNQIILDVAPSLVTKEKLKNESEFFIKEKMIDENQIYYSLLIGGNGSGYTYDNDFFDNLITFVKELSSKNNISWLITTSRRTSIDIEKRLEDELKNYSSYFVSYNKKEEKVLVPFLGLSTKIFVTEESASMISEAISSSKPVFTLKPKTVNSDENYQKIIEKFTLENRIISISNFELKENTKFNLIEENKELQKLKELI
jgi:uncharacterized protein